MHAIAPTAEWIEPDGLGGFASGTVSGIRTRRSHALLLTATTPPTGRVVLVNGFEAHVKTARGTYALSSQRYAPDVIHPDGARRIEAFTHEPWPHWRFRLTNDLTIDQELFVRPGQSAIYLSWRMEGDPGAELKIRPLLSVRDMDSVQCENGEFRFAAARSDEQVVWQPYDSLPAVVAYSNGRYVAEADWFRNFLYVDDQDVTEDLASPGTFEFDLTEPAVLIFGAYGYTEEPNESSATRFVAVREGELERRREFLTPLHRAADAYIVKRGESKTIVAGYPQFGDRARDTFISLRGLCLTTGRLEDARDILLHWAGVMSEGMLPDNFPGDGERPKFRSADASLWFVIAAGDYLRTVENKPGLTSDCHTETLRAAVDQILEAYYNGNRAGVRADDDGLLRNIAGKPIALQALWLNAIAVATAFAPHWEPIFEHARRPFEERFWNADGEYLYDAVDCDNQTGGVDRTFRANQLLAVGGLPLVLLPNEKARKVVDAVEARLLTPLGLRPSEGDESATASPSLIGAFVEAWLRVRGNSAEAKHEAAERFVMPFIEHLHHAGLGHVSETVEADPPNQPRDCPFYACSLAELLRLDSLL